jgi:glycosyltransferase involved in cell wall biosynthesis
MITVAVMSFQGERYLADAIGSVLAQERRPDRIAVVDDRSDDRSQEIARSFAGEGVQLVVNDQRIGLGANWTRAARLADDGFVAVLHHDDRWRPGFLRSLAERLEEAPAADAVVCASGLIDEAGAPLALGRHARRYRAHGGDFDRRDDEALLCGNTILAPTWLARRRLFDDTGFDPALGWAVDWDFWLRTCATPGRVLNEPAVLADYRVHAGSASNSTETLRRRVAEERAVLARALAQRDAPPRIERAAWRALDSRVTGYAAQTLAARHPRDAVALLGALARERGTLAPLRGALALPLSPEALAAAAAAGQRLRSRISR